VRAREPRPQQLRHRGQRQARCRRRCWCHRLRCPRTKTRPPPAPPPARPQRPAAAGHWRGAHMCVSFMRAAPGACFTSRCLAWGTDSSGGVAVGCCVERSARLAGSTGRTQHE
jgi:hypothetical protein